MIQIYKGDCRALATKHIEPESVDLIFTDPPYIKKYLYLYGWLAEEAARVLRPGGFLLAYAGVYWKKQVMARLNSQLYYFWDFVIENGGNSPIMWQRKVISRHKSILAYCKDETGLPRCNVLSFWRGGGEDKRFHRWGQDESSARYYIDCFSKRGDLVVDYMLGGGTTGFICKKLDREFIGFEIEKETFNIARDRIEKADTLLEYDQMRMFK